MVEYRQAHRFFSFLAMPLTSLHAYSADISKMCLCDQDGDEFTRYGGRPIYLCPDIFAYRYFCGLKYHGKFQRGVEYRVCDICSIEQHENLATLSEIHTTVEDLGLGLVESFQSGLAHWTFPHEVSIPCGRINHNVARNGV